MTKKPETGDALHALADTLVDDLMSLTDAELLAEARNDGVDPEAEAAELRSQIAAAMVQSGKARLQAAKAALKQAQAQSMSAASPLRIQDRSRVLAQFAGNDERLSSRLTMAARNGEAATDRELESIMRDLRDLRAIDDEGNPV